MMLVREREMERKLCENPSQYGIHLYVTTRSQFMTWHENGGGARQGMNTKEVSTGSDGIKKTSF